MDQKLIILDLDGTTLNNQSQITDRTRDVVKKAAARGHIVSIMTGRPYRLAKPFYQRLGLKSPIITFNGGLGLIPHTRWSGEFQSTFDRKIVFQIMKDRQKLGINLMTAEDRTHVLSNRAASTELSKNTLGYFPDRVTPSHLLNRQNLDFDPVCLAIQVQPHQEPKIERYVRTHFNHAIKPAPWGGPYHVIELAGTAVTKLNGIQKLAADYQIPNRDIIAFGDQMNDQGMIRYVGHGVAMKNALPQVKAVANDVTTYDNEHDGMARYLQKYLNL